MELKTLKKLLGDLKKRRFFRKSPLRRGYMEKVPGKSVIARTEGGRQVIVTGFFNENAPADAWTVQYHNGKQFRYLPGYKLSDIETIPPIEEKPA
jgi:hypothetical protein